MGDDNTLVNRIQGGDSSAENELYTKYKKYVYNIIKSKYSYYHEINDDVSDIMIKLFMNLDKFDPNKSKFKSWVYSITQNHLIDKWRGNGRVSFTNTSLPLDYEVTTSLSYDINNFDNVSSINYLSEQLDDRDFTLLNMKYLEGYNYDEIGREFNVTSTTISNRVNYIKTKLKKNNKEVVI